MSTVRVLVGTRKGAFILTSDGKREQWDISGPHFAGWEMYHLKGSPADPKRLYASQSSGWFGQLIQRSDDGGQTWEPVGNEFGYEGVPGTHQWYDGSQHPWEFKRVWYLEPSPTDPDTVYAGVEDAALFRSSDGGKSWQELAGLRRVKGHLWQPGAGGMCLHTILLDPNDPNRIFVAISAAGAFRTDDGGQTWRPVTRGLKSEFELPDPNAEVGHCVHSMAMHRSRPGVLFMQKHWDIMRSDDAGESWYEVSGNLPSDFGFPIAVHAHEPDTIYVIPIKSAGFYFDEYLLGYRDRRAVLNPTYAGKVVPGGNGMFKPIIVIDGRVVGTWKRTIRKTKVLVNLDPFESLSRAPMETVAVAAEPYGGFLGLPVEIG